MKILLIAVSVLLLSGCSSSHLINDDFVSGRSDIKYASTDQLVHKYHAITTDFDNVFFNESDAIMAELKLRHPTFKWDSVFKGHVEVGMTTDELIWVRGRPFKINRANYGNQWVYGINWAVSYYYFDTDGYLTGWN